MGEKHARRAAIARARQMMQHIIMIDDGAEELIDQGRAQKTTQDLRRGIGQHLAVRESRATPPSARVTAGLAWVPDTAPVT